MWIQVRGATGRVAMEAAAERSIRCAKPGRGKKAGTGVSAAEERVTVVGVDLEPHTSRQPRAPSGSLSGAEEIVLSD